ncbi:hypothetical protein RIF29_05373 [Crotalaria pallida]|uniref:Uncharacterized protein n=1 Tax=Crotalaria pallida TaxID=3830 RepID=A0AAN9J4J4_CROPI
MVLGTCTLLLTTHKPLPPLSHALAFSSRPINSHLTLPLPIPLQTTTTSIRFSSLHPFTTQPRFLTFRPMAVLSDDGSGGRGDSGGSDSGGGGGGGDGSAGGGGEGEMWSFLSWYLTLLEKYPVPIKALTSALLTLFGDLICQLVIDKVQSVDLKRTFLFTLLGFALVGPTLHFWYLSLSKLVTLTGASGALLRLVIDQFLFAPIFIGIFLSTLVTLEGKPSQAVPKLKQEWFSAVVDNWKLWIPFQFFNFRFMPQQFQVLGANVIALVWNVILSFKAHKEVISK